MYNLYNIDFLIFLFKVNKIPLYKLKMLHIKHINVISLKQQNTFVELSICDTLISEILSAKVFFV